MVGQRPRCKVWLTTSHRPQYCVRIMSVLVLELMWLCVGVYTQSPGEGIFRIEELSSTMSIIVFLVHPTSVAAVDGSTVEFTCTANNTDTIVYRVNGTSATLGSVTSKGFNQLDPEELDTLVIRRNLSVTVSSLYNNTEILCRAIGNSNVDSNTATLTVQGNTHAHDNQ